MFTKIVKPSEEPGAVIPPPSLQIFKSPLLRFLCVGQHVQSVAGTRDRVLMVMTGSIIVASVNGALMKEVPMAEVATFHAQNVPEIGYCTVVITTTSGSTVVLRIPGASGDSAHDVAKSFLEKATYYCPSSARTLVTPDFDPSIEGSVGKISGLSAVSTPFAKAMKSKQKKSKLAAVAEELQKSPPREIKRSAGDSPKTNEFRRRINRLYEKRNPEALNAVAVEQALIAYRGKQEQLLSHLVDKYGAEPSDSEKDEPVGMEEEAPDSFSPPDGPVPKAKNDSSDTESNSGASSSENSSRTSSSSDSSSNDSSSDDDDAKSKSKKKKKSSEKRKKKGSSKPIKVPERSLEASMDHEPDEFPVAQHHDEDEEEGTKADSDGETAIASPKNTEEVAGEDEESESDASTDSDIRLPPSAEQAAARLAAFDPSKAEVTLVSARDSESPSILVSTDILSTDDGVKLQQILDELTAADQSASPLAAASNGSDDSPSPIRASVSPSQVQAVTERSTSCQPIDLTDADAQADDEKGIQVRAAADTLVEALEEVRGLYDELLAAKYIPSELKPTLDKMNAPLSVLDRQRSAHPLASTGWAAVDYEEIGDSRSSLSYAWRVIINRLADDGEVLVIAEHHESIRGVGGITIPIKNVQDVRLLPPPSEAPSEKLTAADVEGIGAVLVIHAVIQTCTLRFEELKLASRWYRKLRAEALKNRDTIPAILDERL